jgi:AMP-polyphosphate phosphotransferase
VAAGVPGDQRDGAATGALRDSPAKFWLHIDPDEQLRRFRKRQEIAHKQWKITDEDWRNHEKLDQYRDAVEEMLHRTTTPYAPWTIVESNCKRYARVKVLEVVCEAIRQRLE